MIAAALAVLATFGLSLATERVAAARGAPPPSLAALPARLGLVLLLFGAWLGLTGRLGFAAVAASVTLAVLVAISVRKRALVGEPLVFSDFALLRLIVRHPDLYYLGFLSDPLFIAGALGLAGAVAVWLVIEPAILSLSAAAGLLLGVGVAVAALSFAAARPGPAGLLRRLLPGPDLERDVGHLGLLLTLVLYALRWRGDLSVPFGPGPKGPVTGPATLPRPDAVVLVQLESFVDPVRLGLADAPLPGLARARALAFAQGPLRVPSHGAFTMRSEYAVLTGLSPAESGFRQFDPYLSSSGTVPATVASRLRETGFRTLFLHPFRAGFFNREIVMARLGFERALWEEDFAGAERVGPYVADRALARRILAELDRAEGPILATAVTMENHGPWSAGRLPDEPDPRRQYLRHLANTDRAIADLLDGLAGRPGRILLCVWGDHPPILPGLRPEAAPETVYALVEFRDGAPVPGNGAPLLLAAHELGRLLVTRTGASGPGAAPPA